MCHFGHTDIAELAALPDLLMPYSGKFAHSHCYAVHHRALDRLVSFLTRTLTNEPDNAEGAQMYTDGAFFRPLNKDIEVVVTNPSLVAQRGMTKQLSGTPLVRSNQRYQKARGVFEIGARRIHFG